MADIKSIIANVEEEENVIAAAQHMVRALGTNKNLTDDVRKILEDLDIRLSSMSLPSETKGGGVNEIEKQLSAVQAKLMNWESDQSMIWDCGTEAASEYLQAVDEVQRLTESLGSLGVKEDGEDSDLLRRSHSVLQIAMKRLEEEFSHILIQHKQSFEPEHMSFRSCEEDIVDEDADVSVEVEDYPVEESPQRDKSPRRDSSGRVLEDYIIDLVHPDMIPELKCIAKAMFTSNYDQECCQAYISIRKDALDECLYVLEVEKLSIEEILRMGWATLSIKIKKWIRAMKLFMRVYLASEKHLCDQIFEEFESVKPTCFIEITKAPVFQLVNFGEAIAMGTREPDKLFRIIDMYEVLADLLPDIDTLFSDDAGSSVRIESRETLKRLGEAVTTTVTEFENIVGSNISTNPFAGGGIHHLTKYVMNYIKVLIDYRGTLNVILRKHEVDNPEPSSPIAEEENEGGSSTYSDSPVAHHLRSLTSVLETNLDSKSKLYRDGSLQHFFLMNNIYYMVQKVKKSELRPLFGDDWIRQHNGKFQQHAMNYERATWSPILSLLKDEGMFTPGSNSISKTVLKERFKSFNLAFEEVYRNQTGWLIPDLQLREDLRISVSLKVIQAYRTFMGRHAGQLESGRHIDRYIKYSADDLQSFLLEFFEGSPKSLVSRRR